MILGIDIGGTKTLLGLFELDGDLKKTYKFPTPQGYDEFIEALRDELSGFVGKNHVNECVVAVPGKLDRVKGIGIAFGNRPWENVPVGSDISKILGIPVNIENDSKLAGLSEALLIPKYRKVFYLTVSTGLSGAFVVGGRLDKNTIDAEVGHMLLEHEGRLRTWESFASGKAIFNKFGKKAAEITSPGDWYIVARNIAIGLIDVIATMTPDAIVIGGGVGAHFDKFKDKLEEELQIYKTNVVDIPPVFGAQKAEEAVIYGCYALGQQA